MQQNSKNKMRTGLTCGNILMNSPYVFTFINANVCTTVLHNYYCTLCLASSPHSMNKIPWYAMTNVTSACDRSTVSCLVHGLVPHHWLPSQWVLSWHMFQGITRKIQCQLPILFWPSPHSSTQQYFYNLVYYLFHSVHNQVFSNIWT